MRRLTLYYFAITSITLISIFCWIPIAISSEIKTLEDLKKSAFIKKYQQKRQMDSWPLRDGRYNNSFSFKLGTDEYSWFLVEVVTKSNNNSIVQNYGVMFHDESNPSIRPTKFTRKIREIFEDFIKSVDSTLKSNDITNYVQKQSVVKYRQIMDAPKKTFGKYSFRVGTVGHDLHISIDKTQ